MSTKEISSSPDGVKSGACYNLQNSPTAVPVVHTQKNSYPVTPGVPCLGGRYLVEVFHKDIKVVKGFSVPKSSHDRSPRTEITLFSSKSRQNLLKTCRNSGHLVQSQFCLTYHDLWPINGKELKRQIDTFLKRLRRRFNDIAYLWVLEFQKRGAPHFHFFSSLQVNPENHSVLTDTWLDVTGQQSDDLCRRWHDHSSNFFAWTMTNGSYVSKYAEKMEQKDVPEGFLNVGRFWGSSRTMVPRSYFIDPTEVEDPELAGVIERAIRSISKNEERKRAVSIRNRKRLLVRTIQSLESAKHRDSSFMEEVEKTLEDARRRLKDFCAKSKKVKKLRNRLSSYTIIFATPLFFQFMESFHQSGRFISSTIIPF